MKEDLNFDRDGRDFRLKKIMECKAQFQIRLTKWLPIFVITQLSLLCILPPPMSPGPNVGTLTLLINSRGPDYQIKSVMAELTINNYSILYYIYYLSNFTNFRNTNEFVMYRDVKSQLRNDVTTWIEGHCCPT